MVAVVDDRFFFVIAVLVVFLLFSDLAKIDCADDCILFLLIDNLFDGVDLFVFVFLLWVFAMIAVVDGANIIFNLSCCRPNHCWFAHVGRTGAPFHLTVVVDA